ncbi:MAG: NAD-binding oxidoreductase, partial [Halocynthiibacter sp.]
MGKLFSYKNRPFHQGAYPLEKLTRVPTALGADQLGPQTDLSFRRPDDPLSIVNAMQEYQAMLDATREGLVKKEIAEIPTNLQDRSDHLKSFAYFCDTSMAGVCAIPPRAWLGESVSNPDVDRLGHKLETMQVKTLAAGVDVVMANLREALRTPNPDCRHHTHAIVLMYDHQRDPRVDEAGSDWIHEAHEQRAALRGMETAVTLASYIRSLGHDARAHSMAATDVHLNRLALESGLAAVENGQLKNPFIGEGFTISVVTTTLEMAPDQPIAPGQSGGISWTQGLGKQAKNAKNRDPFSKRDYVKGAHPFETLKRVDDTTTYIDAVNVARVPKRANMFARSLFGDLGKHVQEGAKNGNFMRKSASAFAFRPSLGAFILLQDGEAAEVHPSTLDPDKNAANIKAALYWLGVDACGLSACPDFAYYSHDAAGQAITPYHDNAISMVID